VRTVRWGPRTLDVDVLLYGDTRVDDAELTVPHPRLWERDFVLVPLRDIAPERVERLAHDGSGVRDAGVALRGPGK
jgi:2-amino-4-hydroxy-6-hydroxymethyldihydropteridine diphosphokinase